MRRYNYHAPNDRDTKYKMRSMYKPGIAHQEVRFSARKEQATAWFKNTTIKKYHDLVPQDPTKTANEEHWNIPTDFKKVMDEGIVPYFNQDWRRIRPELLLATDASSYIPFIGTVFAAFIAGFFFEAYGTDKDLEESFLETDEDSMEEDACGRFYA
jgi:hypothetical protein